MQKIRETLKVIDLFGVPVKVLTEKTDQKFQSIYGGVISIIISAASLTYLIYMVNMWASGNILPNVSLISKVIDYAEFEWDETLINFSQSDQTSKIDPFSSTNNIITPLLFKIINYQLENVPQVLFSDLINPSNINVNNGSVILNNMNIIDYNHKPFAAYLLIFAKCSDVFLTSGGNCATQEIIDQYLSEFHGFLSINVKLRQYNYKTNSFDIITKSRFQALSPTYPQFTQLSFKLQNTIIDDGFLLTNRNQFQSINDFEMINQSIDKKYISNIVNSFGKITQSFDTVIAFQITLDNISITQEITLPKVNTLLAQIGSIIQVIFFLKYLALYINNNLIDSDLFHNIVLMYYPNIKQVIIRKNFFGKIVSAKHKNQEYKVSDQFFVSYRQLIDIAKKKTRFINILYEISRLQFLLQQHHGREQIVGCHELGSTFNLNLELGSENINRASVFPEDTILNEIFNADINLLTKGEDKIHNQVINFSY